MLTRAFLQVRVEADYYKIIKTKLSSLLWDDPETNSGPYTEALLTHSD